MKGLFFQKPFEFQIEITGERFIQGDWLRGTLKVKNRSSQTETLGAVKIELADGNIKRVHAKKENAFDVLEKIEIPETGTLTAGAEKSFTWEKKLSPNAPVTDPLDSLYILYGPNTEGTALGNLQLHVQPTPLIQQFLSSFQTNYQFVTKKVRGSKGWTEAKLIPPSGAKEFATLEELTARFRLLEDETLETKFELKRKQLGTKSDSTALAPKTLEKEFPKTEYINSIGKIAFEPIEKTIGEVIGLVSGKFLS